jgi:hypothetical protein
VAVAIFTLAVPSRPADTSLGIAVGFGIVATAQMAFDRRRRRKTK